MFTLFMSKTANKSNSLGLRGGDAPNSGAPLAQAVSRKEEMDNSEKVLERLAFTTWDTISHAYNNRISYGEDAITSVNLLTLKNAQLNNLVLQDTRIHESIKGCDFEFWIGSNKKGWFRYAIQAKKISVSNERYNSLYHQVRGQPQIDILDNYASANNAVPLYCLFSYSKHTHHVANSCPKYISIKELGCSVTPSKTVRKALSTRGARTFQWLHNRQETIPWSCLVRCPKIHRHWSPSILGINYEDMRYKELPYQLRLLLEDQSQEEELIYSDIFSSENENRPRWIGVLETVYKDENG